MYDTMNRLDTMLFTFDGQTALFDYAYDLVGRQTQSALTLNNVADRTINIEYDYLGRAISAELTWNAINDILAEFDYNAVGALTDVRRFEWDDTDELYNLIAQSQYQYNARNQITNISHADAADSVIASHSYLFSPDGNITQYTNSIDGTVNYTNDFLGQLIGADYSNLDIHDESYQYDLNGNRELVTNANGDLVVYSTGTNNELNSDGNYSYAYDAEGNRISKTNAAGTERELYEWDYRNRLSRVTKQEYNTTTEEWETVQIVEYAYDYNNVLIRKDLDANGDGVSDSKTIFIPEDYQVAIQLDDADLSDLTDATVSHRYLWTPQNQDKLLADVTPTETLWTLSDHLGTIRDVVKNTPSGLVVPAHIIYDAYGNVLSCKDANGTDVSTPVLFGFTGKYFDADTQLQNNVNRLYDSIIGRWLSTDPIGFNGNDTNLYRYVGNRVIVHLDIKGLDITINGGTCYAKHCESFLTRSNTITSEKLKEIIEKSNKVNKDCDDAFQEIKSSSNIQSLLNEYTRRFGTKIIFNLFEFPNDFPEPSLGLSVFKNNKEGCRIYIGCRKGCKPNVEQMRQDIIHEIQHCFDYPKYKTMDCSSIIERELRAYYKARSCNDFHSCMMLAIRSSCIKGLCENSDIFNDENAMRNWKNNFNLFYSEENPDKPPLLPVL